MSANKPLYSANAIIFANSAKLSSLSRLSLFDWGIKLGNKRFAFESLEKRNYSNGRIIVHHGLSVIQFYVCSCISSRIDEFASHCLFDAINAICVGDVSGFTLSVAKLNRLKSNGFKQLLFILIYAVMLGMLGGLYFELLSNYPYLLGVFIIVYILGNLSVAVYYRVRNRRIVGDILVWRLRLPRGRRH